MNDNIRIEEDGWIIENFGAIYEALDAVRVEE